MGVVGRIGIWRYKNFVQSGEWALTVIAPTGGVVAGANRDRGKHSWCS